MKKNFGFTLMELMIAALMLVLISTAILGTLLTCIALSKSSRNTTIALNEARLVLEQMRNTLDSSGTGLPVLLGAWPNNFTGTGNSVLTNELITVTYANTGTDPLQATVTVAWSQRRFDQRDRSVQLVTLFTQR